MNSYEITVTPKMNVWAGTYLMGQYTVTIYAKNRAAAISRARADRRAEEGRQAIPATFSARKVN